jgi:hypothetical protein
MTGDIERLGAELDMVERFVFHIDGNVNTIRFYDESGNFRELVGLKYIRTLLQNNRASVAELRGDIADGPADVVVDEESRRAAENKLLELEREIAEAELTQGSDEIERLENDKRKIEEYLRDAQGLGGRARRLESQSSRVSVRQAISRAIAELNKGGMPRLARHLEDSIQGGWNLEYRPADPAPFWVF